MHDRLFAAFDQGQELVYLRVNDPWNFVSITPAGDQKIGIQNDLPQSSLVGLIRMVFDRLRFQQSNSRCPKRRYVADDESTRTPHPCKPDPLANGRIISDCISNAWIDPEEGVDRASQGYIALQPVSIPATCTD